VASSAKPKTCQVCDCVSDREGKGRMVCYECLVHQFDLVGYNWNKFAMNLA